MSRMGFNTRRAQRSPQQTRADWASSLALACSLATVALGEVGADDAAAATFGQNLTRLTLTLRDLAPDNFPVVASSAQTMAAAFLKLARDFAHPSWAPASRTACAPFLRAGAECLERLIIDLRAQEARGWRSQFDRDED